MKLTNLIKFAYILAAIFLLSSPPALGAELFVTISFQDGANLSAIGLKCALSISEEAAKQGKYDTAQVADEHNIVHFDSLDPQTYWLTILPDGFGSGKPGPFMGYIIPKKPEKVDIGDGFKEMLTVKLRRGFTVFGQALKADGSPVTKAIVGSIGVHSTQGYLTSDGRFEVAGLVPGEVSHIEVTPVDLLFRYTLCEDIHGENAVAGASVDMGSLTFTTLTGQTNFAGSVVDSQGKPEEGIHLFWLYSETRRIKGTLAIVNGKFSQEFPPGRYKIVVPAFEDRSEIEVAWVELNPGQVVRMNLKYPQMSTLPSTNPDKM